MKKLLCFVVLFISAAELNSQSLVNVIPAPNYSYGLTHDGTDLWVGSSNGFSIWRIDETGSVLGSITSVTDETRGLGWDGSNLWGYQYLFGSSAANKDMIIKYASGGSPLDTLLSPYEDYIGGMCWAQGYLYISVYYTGSGNPAYIIKIDPVTNSFVDTLIAPGLQPQGLAFDGHSLWCAMDDNDGDPERLWELDIATGDTISSFPIPPYGSTVTASPKDLAYNNGYLYLVVGPSTNKAVYKFDIAGGGTPQIGLSSDELFFPMTTVGSPSSVDLLIANTGNAQLIVDSINFNQSFFSFNPIVFPLQIDPGNSETVTVNFSPGGYAYYNGMMSIFNNDPLDPVATVELHGQGLLGGPVINLSDASHNFGSVWVAIDGTAYWQFYIYNSGDQNLEISQFELDLPEFSVKTPGLPLLIQAADTAEIKVTFTPQQSGMYTDTLKISSNDPSQPEATIILNGTGFLGNYNYGYVFWNYQIPANPNTSFQEYRVEGLKPINDITGDGVDEVIVATDNYWILCLDGSANGFNEILWSFNTYISNLSAGSIGGTGDYGVQDALGIAEDLNGDGYNDVVIGTGGGNEHVYALDGTNGQIIWEFGDNINSSLGDFEAVDVKRDFNGDSIPDVLAIAGGNQTGTGYKRAYLFNGSNGAILWDYVYPGPNLSFGKAIISVDDINSDGLPDAVIGVGNNGTTDLKVYGLNGATGFPFWEFEVSDYEPKELLALPIPGESPDIIAAEYFGIIYRLDGASGTQRWTYNLGALAGVIQMNLIKDINGDAIDDILVAAFTSGLTCLSGDDGMPLWNYSMAYQYGVYSVPDLNNDGIDDVITGDQNGTVFCLSGDGQYELFSYNFSGDRVSAVNVMPSIDGNASYELLAGTRSGKLVCFSGGLQAVPVELIRFDATYADNTVVLEWTTVTETNNSGFFVERKIDKNWESLYFVEGKGNSTEPQSYSYIDNISDIEYHGPIGYRIKQVDFDGSYDYSEEIQIDLTPVNYAILQNYPNPFNPTTTIEFSIPIEQKVSIKVYDILGNEIAVLLNELKTAGYHKIIFNANGLSSGIYFYKIDTDAYSDIKKMVYLK